MNIKTFCPELLTYVDLLQLLKEDPIVQGLIRDCLKYDTRPLLEPLPKTNPAADPLRQQLESDLNLLKLLASDDELRQFWLGSTPATEGAQLRQLLAVAAQWERILQLWDFLAGRCKHAQHPASLAEQQLLAGCLAIHNLIWTDKTARLLPAQTDTAFAYQHHERGTAKGDHVTEEWLPGLQNAGGEVQKKPLVNTR